MSIFRPLVASFETAPKSSAYGTALPLVFGRNRIPGQLVWISPYRADDTYAMLFALCEGEIGGVLRSWKDKTVTTGTGPWFAPLGTRPTQTPWSTLTTYFPDAAIGYPGVALLGMVTVKAGPQAAEGRSYEVNGLLAGSGDATTGDAHPADVIIQLLTNTSYGAGYDSSKVVVNVGQDGNAASSLRNYATAEGFYISPALTQQRSGLDWLREILDSVNADAIWSDGKLKIVPLGDQASGSYTPVTTPQYALTADDFLADGDEPPIEVERTPISETFNISPVEFLERETSSTDPANAYNTAVVEDPEPVDVGVNGPRRESVVSLHSICVRSTALKIARIRAQRNVFTRNSYRFKLGWRHCRLEPLDLVSLTEPTLGLAGKIVRIVSIEEGEDFSLDVRAIEWPFGTGSAVAHTTQSSESDTSMPPEAMTTPASQGDVTGSLVMVYSQAIPPSVAISTGSIWFDSDDGNHPYRYDGTSWVSMQDGAITDGAAALVLAGSKSAVFYQTTAPSNPIGGYTPRAGDMWFDTTTFTDSDGLTKTKYEAHRWDGSSWVAADQTKLIVAAEIAAGAITADKVAAGSITAQHIRVASKSLNIDPTFSGGSSLWPGFVRRLPNTDAAVPSSCPVTWASEFNARDCYSVNYIPVVPGEVYKVSGYVNKGTGSGGTGVGIVGVWVDDHGALSGFTPATTTASGWQFLSGEVTVPATQPTSGRPVAAFAFGPWADRPTYTGQMWAADFNMERKADASLIVDGAITAGKIAAGQIKTSNYTQDGSGNPTAGAKLDHTGNALMVAPGNLQVGSTILSSMWFANAKVYTGMARANGSGGYAGSVNDSSVTVTRVAISGGFALRIPTGISAHPADFVVCPYWQIDLPAQQFGFVQPYNFDPATGYLDVVLRGTSGSLFDPATTSFGAMFIAYQRDTSGTIGLL